MTYKKKLIEVALPLEEISWAASKEKSTRQGNISTIHLWWSRKPIAAAKAVIFASLIDDPSNFLPQKEADKARKKLFELIAELVKWNNPKEKEVLKKVKNLILKSTKNNPPAILDPFCGGGSIPLAGQILGLDAYGGDLNPVATLISKAIIEIPPKFNGLPALNPTNKMNTLNGKRRGACGLAEDVRYYGNWIKIQTMDKIGKLYPKGPKGKTVVAWLYCRTVRCQNPACGCLTPLVSKWWVCRRDNEKILLNPIYSKKTNSFEFELTNKSQDNHPIMNRKGGTCLNCGSLLPFNYLRKQGRDGKLDLKLTALILEGEKRKEYSIPNQEQIEVFKKIKELNILETNLPDKALGFRIQQYGMTKHKDLFTPRQLMALDTFSSLISETKTKIVSDLKNNENLSEQFIEEYSKAVCTYLALAVDRAASYWSKLCWWNPSGFISQTFGRQALPMIWDTAEVNPFSDSTGNWSGGVEWIAKVLERIDYKQKGEIKNLDAAATLNFENIIPIISTDPPYYDNIGYSDLSDFFYVWLRKSLSSLYPDLFATLLTPKNKELVATQFRFKNKDEAKEHFMKGLKKSFELIKDKSKDYPITIYYAFKQTESEKDVEGGIKISSSGWESVLYAILDSGLEITGTWPIRTERTGRPVEIGTNALASSIVIVCRPRPKNEIISTRREFIKELKKELPSALKKLQEAGIAPVDMAQSAIGLGMAVFSKYSKVLEADGNQMSIRTALQIINQELDAFLTEQESDMDQETRFCIAWYEQFGWKEGPFGDANTLATAKGTAVNALETAEVVYAKAGKVRLLKRSELDDDWDPTTDKKLTVWECVQHLIKRLDQEGEDSAAKIIRKIGGLAESVKELTYRLYSMCEKKGWTEDGIAYNTLISSWQSTSDKAQYYDKISEETKKRLKDKTQKKLDDL